MRFCFITVRICVTVVCSETTIDLAVLVDGSGSICDDDPTRTDFNGVVSHYIVIILLLFCSPFAESLSCFLSI